jgi:uncharacterized protein (DUF433 family)
MVAYNRDDIADADTLIEAWIERNPIKRSKGDSRIKEYCISVWALVGHLKGVGWSVESAARDYRIPVDAVRAAVAYYDRYTDVIEDRLEANEV